MREYQENEMRNEPDKIDISYLITDLIRGVKKLWWLVIGLAVIFGAASYLKVTTTYRPTYVASATMAVGFQGTNSNYINIQSAQQMAEVFPYILTSGVLEDVVAEDLGLDYLPGSITATAESGINLFTLSVTADDAQLAYDILQSVIKNYPEVARFVLGETTLRIMDETGVPEDTGKVQVFRGSLKLGAMKGASLGLLIMAFYVLTRHAVKSRKELRKQVNLEDYGSLPYILQKKRKKRKDQSQMNLLNERIPQIYLEAVRKLRIKIMKEMEQKDYKTLMITSSVPGEGKSTVAVNLAIAIAKQGKKVILVDTDSRNPSVAKLLKLKGRKEKGLGAVLRKELPVESALKKITVENGELLVLCSEEADPANAKMLGTLQMKRLIEQLKKEADIVILDTPPSELLADAPALGKYVEAALYVVRYDHAKVRQIRKGVQALAMSGVDILGYTFNFDNTGVKRGYGYGYQKYSGYGRYGNYARMLKNKEKNSGRVIKD